MGAQSFLVPVQTVGSQTLWRGAGLILKNLQRFFKTRGWGSPSSALIWDCVQVLASTLPSFGYFIYKTGITMWRPHCFVMRCTGQKVPNPDQHPMCGGSSWNTVSLLLPWGDLLQQNVHNCESLRLIPTESPVAITQSHPASGLVYQRGQGTQGGIGKGSHQGTLSQRQGQEVGGDSWLWWQQSLPFPVARALPTWSRAPWDKCLCFPGQSVLMSLTYSFWIGQDVVWVSKHDVSF